MAKFDKGSNATVRKKDQRACPGCACNGCNYPHSAACLKCPHVQKARCPDCQKPKGPAKPKQHKYSAVRTEYNGVTYDSKKEAKRAQELDFLLRAGEIQGPIRRQVAFPVEIHGIHVFKWMADFVYFEKGQEVIEDVKGMATDVYKIKKKCIEAYYGVKIKET